MKKSMMQGWYALLVLSVMSLACDTAGTDSMSDTPQAAAASRHGGVEASRVYPWMAAGDIGGGVLSPGDLFPATRAAKATLVRHDNSVEVSFSTDGLPAGAYTAWWSLFNNPDVCLAAVTPEVANSRCGGATDDYFNPETMASVYYLGGAVVEAGQIWSFTAKTAVGDDLGAPGLQLILGSGLVYPDQAEVQVVLRYHGPASDDPAVQYEQTHTFGAECLEGANGVDVGFGPECFNPQVAAFGG
ncbi:MAG: hypothetical protein SH809_10925 [Rhodothermales bacterium]|nr:hypothetical protein [Rhodothermales bacterium]